MSNATAETSGSGSSCAACSIERVCQALNVSGTTVVASSTSCAAGSTVIVETLELQSLCVGPGTMYWRLCCCCSMFQFCLFPEHFLANHLRSGALSTSRLDAHVRLTHARPLCP